MVERAIDDVIAEVGGFFFCFLVADNFDADHQAAAADVADDFEFVFPARGFLEDVIAKPACVFAVFRFDEFKGGQAAAMHTGLPPKVVPCEPGFQFITLSRAMMAPRGMPLAMPLAEVIMSGSMPDFSPAHQLPVRPMPDCTSSAMSMMPWRRQMRWSS